MKEGILNMKRGTWAEINLNNIKHNFHALKNTLKSTHYIHPYIELPRPLHSEIPRLT